MAGIAQKLHLGGGGATTGGHTSTTPLGAAGQYPGYQPGTFGYDRNPRDQKAARFEQKALQYQQQGNLVKAQKNRDKAARHRQYMTPGYQAPMIASTGRHDKAARLDAKALRYEQKGNTNKALRSRQRAQRIRQKHGLGSAVAAQPGLAKVGVPVGMVGQQPIGVGMGQGIGLNQGMGVQHQTVMMPAIVQETVRTDRIVEIQPVIHREVDQTTVHHIERHVTEMPAANRGGVVQMAPIVQETVQTRIVDEVTPVIHREVAQTVVERVEEHTQQRVVAPTQHTNQVVFDQSRGFAQGYQRGTYGYSPLTRDAKAIRYEQKAQRYQAAGNMAKAQKNMAKAQRHRQRMAPGYVRQPYTPAYGQQKLGHYNQKAALYDQRGNTQKANLFRQRAARHQAKYGRA